MPFAALQIADATGGSFQLDRALLEAVEGDLDRLHRFVFLGVIFLGVIFLGVIFLGVGDILIIFLVVGLTLFVVLRRPRTLDIGAQRHRARFAELA